MLAMCQLDYRSVTRCMARCAVALCGLSVCGCASWKNESKTEDSNMATSLLHPQKAVTDSATIDSILVRFDENSYVELEQIWRSVDETVIEINQRRLLDQNGLRVGVIRGELPKQILDQIAAIEKRQKNEVVEQIGLGSESDSRVKTLMCRTGKRKELIVRRDINRPLSVFTTLDGSLSGNSFDRAAALFGMTLYPHDDGSVLVELVPEVQHGEAHNTYVSTEFGMKQELKREAKVWKQLKIQAPLTPGELLVVAATSPSKAIGHAFFTSENINQKEEKVVLLLRLTSSQIDDLFGNTVEQARAFMESQ